MVKIVKIKLFHLWEGVTLKSEASLGCRERQPLHSGVLFHVCFEGVGIWSYTTDGFVAVSTWGSLT